MLARVTNISSNLLFRDLVEAFKSHAKDFRILSKLLKDFRSFFKIMEASESP